MNKKLLFIFALLTIAAGAVNAEITPSGNWSDEANRDTSWGSDYSSTSSYSFDIYDEADFAQFAYMVTVEGKSFYGKTQVRLNADLNLSAHYWTPIGNSWDTSLSCEFDGQNHTITGVKVNTDKQFAGLFGYLGGYDSSFPSVRNLTLDNSEITTTYSGPLTSYVGGICGFTNNGALVNCHVGSDVTVSGGYGGGIVGGAHAENDRVSTIRECTSTAIVSATSYAGGIVGIHENNSTNGKLVNIYNCFYYDNGLTGTLTGAIVGKFHYGVVDAGFHDNSYYTATNITPTGNLYENLTESQVKRVYKIEIADKNIASYFSTSAGFTFNKDIYAAANVTVNMTLDYAIASFSGTYNSGTSLDITNNSFTMPAYDVTLAATLKNLWRVYTNRDESWGTDYETASSFTISTPKQLAQFAYLVNSGNTFENKTVTLDAQIDLSGNVWQPIGTSSNNFKGIFDGAGKTISGLTVNTGEGNDYKGLFGYALGIGYNTTENDNGAIKNVTIDNCTISGNNYTGGIVGYLNGGYLYNCQVSGTIQAVGNCSKHGGVAGYANNSRIKNCSSSASLTLASGVTCSEVGGIAGNAINVDNCSYSGSTINGSTRVGGIVGYAKYFTNCTVGSDATITAGDKVGGIVGELSNSGSVSNCQASGTIHAATNCNYHGGIVGYYNPGEYNDDADVTNNISSVSLTKADGVTCGNVGGIAGWARQMNVTGCFYTGTTVSGNENVGGIVGYGFRTNLHGCFIDCDNSVVSGTSYIGDLVGLYNDDGLSEQYNVQNCFYHGTTIGGQGSNGSTTGSAITGFSTGYSVTTADPSLSITRGAANVEVANHHDIIVYQSGYNYKGADFFNPIDAYVEFLDNAAAREFNGLACVGGTNVAVEDIEGNNNKKHLTADAGNIEVFMEWAGNGGEYTPYQIAVPNDLMLLASRVNNSTEANVYYGKFFKQVADLNFSSVPLTNGSNFTPIGYYTDGGGKIFSADYDGGGHVIKGITINRTGNSNGIFGFAIGNISDLALTNSTIIGGSYTGGIVGYYEGSSRSISNCHVGSDVTIGTPTTGYIYHHGGIVGNKKSGTVSGCTSAAAITSSATEGSNFGGIVGYNQGGTITNSLYTGTTVQGNNKIGALVGYNTATVSSCFWTNSSFTGSAIGSDTSTNSGRGADDTGDNTKFFETYGALRTAMIQSSYNDDFTALAPSSITLNGRKLLKDGSWNTLCLPFNYDKSGPLAGATIMELDAIGTYGDKQTGFDSDGTLYLYFTEVNSITAGKPYIVKWETTGDPIENPTFNNVTITSTTPATIEAKNSGLNTVQFIGTYGPTKLDANDKAKLYLGDGDKLYYPSSNMDINAFRGYFNVDLTGQPNGDGVRAFVLNFGDYEASSIDNVQCSMVNGQSNNAWYDLQGRRMAHSQSSILNSQLKKGVYINNGKKQVIK